MIDLIQAIADRLKAKPELIGDLPGGFYLDHPGPGTLQKVGRFGVLIPVSGEPEYTTGDDYVEPVTLQFSFFGRTVLELKPTVQAFKNEFNAKPLDMPNGSVLCALIQNEGALYEPADQSDLSAWHYHFDIEFTLDLNLNP